MKDILKKMLKMGLPVPGFIRPVIRMMYLLGVATTEGMIFLRKFFFVEPVLRSVAEVGCRLWADRLPYMRGKGRLIIGNNVRLSGRSCFYFMNVAQTKRGTEQPQINTDPSVAPSELWRTSKHGFQEPVIEIGDNVFIGNGCTFSAAQKITIGSHALISAGVRIHDNDGHPKDAGRRRDGGRMTADEVRPVSIGENAWLGAGAVILKGVQIGRDAIVGAGAIVTGDVPDGATVAGNPAACK